ncbi:calcineurin-like phosphoesterase family protein [Lysobacter sp. Root494]|uniref:calcineurin-like phosphoesterase C-terminal domain-containing protein n=1 Tax=Lysobacter sp. Root494 TaxID=1736549 RepID=UPI0006FD32FE|nr:calcineurin-like phosphoesterase family protein [Lysobacter sp. Root494]KQY52181.1 calcineurin phosphoesterase [Lysobacter sp. Root494]
MRIVFAIVLSLLVTDVLAGTGCNSGTVFEDRNGNGKRDAGEPGIAGVKLSDGVQLSSTDSQGQYELAASGDRALFAIKPANYDSVRRADGLPDLWRSTDQGAESSACDFALRASRPSPNRRKQLSVIVMTDPQVKSLRDVDYYRRDIVEPLQRERAVDMGHGFGQFYFQGLAGDLGLSLGDIVNDQPVLYPAVIATTAKLGVPWLHAAGNHDVDVGAKDDEDSLVSFHRHFGPDTWAWEEPEAAFVVLDDVVASPGHAPAYVGGLREEQFTFLERYLPSVPKDRLLVLAVHIPLFDTAPGVETFRHADRDRLFALLRQFPKVLLLSGHAHAQQHVWHGADGGWHGETPLHEYNVGAACGAFWSGVKDADGIPDSTMQDGTPNGYARLEVRAGGDYRLSWHPVRLPAGDTAVTPAMFLYAPNVLRRGSWPSFGVYANVFMGDAKIKVEYRVDGGAWQSMKMVAEPDPRLLAENLKDDQASVLRGYDRAPPAKPSPHLWRGVLPTDLPAGAHRVQVRAFDRWQGEQLAETNYRLDEAAE